MRKLLRDTRGAVTVFITLLLIPAILVSGTAVDLARIHTAQSTIQNANQLAANAVLTQYNALLYDIYGVMGVAQDDPILWTLLDEYIKVTVFGENHDRSIGTLQVFYGANITLEEPYFPDGQHLRNEDVLRRQIEEYMKFRGPILIVQELIDKLSDNKIKEDAKLIHDKTEIDAVIAEIFAKYKELYDAIVAADRCNQAIGGIAGGSFGHMSSVLTQMHDEFTVMRHLLIAYLNSEDAIERNFFASRYWAVAHNIRSLAIGGPRFGELPNGAWAQTGNINTGLDKAIENAAEQAENFKPKFDTVVEIAARIDEIKAELHQKIKEFEKKLDSGEISAELKESFTQLHGNPTQSLIGSYKALVKWDIEPMARVYRDGSYSYIDDKHLPMLENVKYRDRLNEGAFGLTVGELANIPNDPRFTLSFSSMARICSSFPRDNSTYKMEPGFLKFAEYSAEHAQFYAELHAMMNQPPLPPVKLFDGQEDPVGRDAEEQQRNLINELLAMVNNAFRGLKNEPLGAKHINGAAASAIEDTNILDIVGLIPEATKLPSINIIDNPIGAIGAAGDYLLLLTYSMNMFSNYATSKPDALGKTRENIHEVNLEKTISGVPMSHEVNYFFHSELEYLYNGSENAAANLSAVTRLLFLVRLICNYIRVFSVPEVTAVVTSIKAAFAWAPPLALILGELARAAFVAAESVVDVAALRTGHKVSLFKNIAAGEWVCTPTGVLNAAKDIMLSEKVDGGRFNNSRGFSYMNYMLFFFFTKAIFYSGSDGNAANELAKRTGNLIEWNVINFESNIKADESAMGAALGQAGRFKLEDMKTDFRLTTTADLRMLFLSMAFARGYADSRGIGLPHTVPLRATDYRGY